MIQVFRTKEQDSKPVHHTKQGHPSTLTSKQSFANCNSWCRHRLKRSQTSRNNNEKARKKLLRKIQRRRELRSILRQTRRMQKKIITTRKNSNGNPHLKGIRRKILKIRKGSWKYGRAADMKGPHTNLGWRGPTHHLSLLVASKLDNLPATRSTWRRTSRISGILIILSHHGSCPMLFLMDSSLRRN
jgi:hypothetical protein